ncbi:hypothetical protein ACFV2H_32755 [Streptomyces sp. NPDC059629]|uniref:hypothetical protein n=1 Tax=Streptomyces sp. NPDC059629 TaxID=3346889 RepID=UPI003673EEA7
MSASVLPELTTLQSQTDQIALAYVPNLIGQPARICTQRAIGKHGAELRSAPEAALRQLWCAPLDADAAGLAILAFIESNPAAAALTQIRRQGYAVSRTPLADRDAIAAPLWRGSVVAGSVSLLVSRRHTRIPSTCSLYTRTLLRSATLLSRRMSRSGVH